MFPDWELQQAESAFPLSCLQSGFTYGYPRLFFFPFLLRRLPKQVICTICFQHSDRIPSLNKCRGSGGIRSLARRKGNKAEIVSQSPLCEPPPETHGLEFIYFFCPL